MESSLFRFLCFDMADPVSEIKVWQKRGLPLYIWGAGSVAAGAANKLRRNDIPFDGFFVDVAPYHVDARVRSLRLPVFTLAGLQTENRRFGVVMGHSHYEAARRLRENGLIDKIWCFTDVTRDDIDITARFFAENRAGFQATYDRLSDAASKRNMISFLNAKLTGNAFWILDGFTAPSAYFDNDVLTVGERETYLDLGAYDGSSVAEFIKAAGGVEYQVVAVEVQEEMCAVLAAKFAGNKRIKIIHTGVSGHCGTDTFRFDGQSTCLGAGGEARDVVTVDALCRGRRISIIKICIGNTVSALLKGARETIFRDLPKIIIAAGLDRRALIDYVPLIDSLAGASKYKFYLRYTGAMSEALVLYAVPKSFP